MKEPGGGVGGGRGGYEGKERRRVDGDVIAAFRFEGPLVFGGEALEACVVEQFGEGADGEEVDRAAVEKAHQRAGVVEDFVGHSVRGVSLNTG